MVLEEATTPASEGVFVDAQPASDSDAYSYNANASTYDSNSNSSLSTSVAQALTRFPNTYGLLTRNATRQIETTCEAATRMLGRPMRQEEVDALVYQLARSSTYSFFGLVVGVAAGVGQCWRRRRVNGFPFYAPGDKLNVNKFGPLKGEAARFAWHTTRVHAYGFVGAVAGASMIGSYGMSLAIVGRATDPRLRDFNAEMKRRMDLVQAEKNAAGRREIDQTPAQRSGETFEMARQRQAVQGMWNNRSDNSRSAQQQQQNVVDDMSPTGGSFKDDYWSGGTSSELLSDSQLQAREQQKQHHESSSLPSRLPASTSSSPQATRDSQSRSSTSSSTTSEPKGAWERLRQQASSSNQTPSTSNSSSTDSASDLI